MKASLGVLVTMMLISRLMATTCPDGNTCAGQCCHKYPLGVTYRCCMPPWGTCRNFRGLGFCFLFSPSNLNLNTTGSDEGNKVLGKKSSELDPEKFDDGMTTKAVAVTMDTDAKKISLFRSSDETVQDLTPEASSSHRYRGFRGFTKNRISLSSG